jgi:hypothetical protein
MISIVIEETGRYYSFMSFMPGLPITEVDPDRGTAGAVF